MSSSPPSRQSRLRRRDSPSRHERGYDEGRRQFRGHRRDIKKDLSEHSPKSHQRHYGKREMEAVHEATSRRSPLPHRPYTASHRKPKDENGHDGRRRSPSEKLHVKRFDSAHTRHSKRLCHTRETNYPLTRGSEQSNKYDSHRDPVRSEKQEFQQTHEATSRQLKRNSEEKAIKREAVESTETMRSDAAPYVKRENTAVTSEQWVKTEKSFINGNNTAPAPVDKSNFEPTGLLASETSVRGGIMLKHSAPPDSRQPTKHWRLYMFKKGADEQSMDSQDSTKIFHIHRQPSYLFGKETRVADIPLFHPTVSKQHAVLQFRYRQGEVRPYIIDLDSTNGTYLNSEKIEPCRYYELKEQDTLRFGRSTRDFVLLHSGSIPIQDIDYEEYLNSRKA